MLSEAAGLITSSRLAAWQRWVAWRLGRHGVDVSFSVAGPVRLFTLPRLEVVTDTGPGGSLRVQLGRDVKLGRELVLEVWTGTDNRLQVGDRTTFEAFCRVQLQGGEIALDHDVHVRDLVLLKTKSRLEVGAHTVLSRGVHVHATAGVTIGAHGAIGERTSFIDSDHTVADDPEPVLRRPIKLAPITLGRNVAISANCVLLRGTTIGDNAVVAAGAVVNGGSFPGGWLIGGLPARQLRELG